MSREELDRLGIEFFASRRGGQLTYHGPGQLVGYPVLDLKAYRADVHWYLQQLEEVLIRVLGLLGIETGRRQGHTGVWVEGRKIASIGVALRRWVSTHGFALNVTPDMGHFQLLNPCGLNAETMTSVAELGGRVPEMAKLAGQVADEFARVFGLRPEQVRFRERAAETLCSAGVE